MGDKPEIAEGDATFLTTSKYGPIVSWILAFTFCGITFAVTYIGLAEFFYFAFLVIVTILVSVFSYRCAGSREFWQLLVQLIWMTPIFELLIGICVEIFRHSSSRLQTTARCEGNA
jgi:hypothetical protein